MSVGVLKARGYSYMSLLEAGRYCHSKTYVMYTCAIKLYVAQPFLQITRWSPGIGCTLHTPGLETHFNIISPSHYTVICCISLLCTSVAQPVGWVGLSPGIFVMKCEYSPFSCLVSLQCVQTQWLNLNRALQHVLAPLQLKEVQHYNITTGS